MKNLKAFLFVLIILGINDLAQAQCPLPALTNDGGTSGNFRGLNPNHKGGAAHFLIKATELTANGYINGNVLTGIGGTFSTAPSISTTGTLVVYLQNTSDVANNLSATWSTAISGMTQVYNASTTIPNTKTWNVTFSSNFTYTGGGLYVGITWTNCGTASTGALVLCNASGLTNGLKGASNATCAEVTTVSASSYRPETRFAKTGSQDLSVSNLWPKGKTAIGIGAQEAIPFSVRNTFTSSQSFVANLTIKEKISGTVRYTQSKSLTIEGCTTATFTFDGWIPLNEETDLVTLEIPAISGEATASNNNKELEQIVDKFTMNHTENNWSGGYIGVGFNTGSGLILARNHVSGRATVSSVRVNITGGTTVGNTVYGVVLNSAGAIVGQSSNYVVLVSDASSYVTFTIPQLPTFTNEDMYVGLAQTANATTGYYPVNSQAESITKPSVFYTTGISGGGISSEYTGLGRWMIEAVFTTDANLYATVANQQSGYCPNSAINVVFVALNCAINAGNIFNIELSDAVGNFSSPTVIGSLSTTNTTGTISCTIPANALPGAGYRVRVTSGNTAITGADNGINIKVNGAPTGPSTQSYLLSEGKTLTDLTSILTGSGIKWYSASSGGTQYTGTETLVTKSYFASQTLNSCESTERKEVAVTIVYPVEVTATLGTASGSYNTLKAAFDAINLGTHQGVITVKITSNTTETASAILKASGGTASYTSVNIYPTAAGLSISGDLGGYAIIDLDDADGVTIDGRVNMSGNADLTISNTYSLSNSSRTIRLINGATNNVIKYCSIKGACPSTGSGVLFFSNSGGTSTGNSNNTIDHCNITNSGVRPSNAIYSSGTSGKENSGNTISNNNIFDVFNTGKNSCGINITSNSTDWTISGNNFYETTTIVPTGLYTYTGISISNASGNNFIVSDNFIGGSDPLHAGNFIVSAATDHYFRGIYLNVGTSVASSVQNNSVQNIAYTSTSPTPWYGIYIQAGNVNFGTTTGNTIGSTTGAGSITVTNSTVNATSYGIYNNSTGTVDIQKNKIGSITLVGSDTFGHTFYGISKTLTAGTTTISNNIIGNATEANNILASSASTANVQSMYGIYCEGTGTNTISSNTIANMTNRTSNTTAATSGLINGIICKNGANNITDNIIHDLTITNTNSNSNYLSSVGGILLFYNTAAAQTITGNTIYGLTNTNASFAGSVIGLYYNGSSTTGTIARNFIHSLSATSANGNLYGVKIEGGVSTSSNNIISLGTGITTGNPIFGFKLSSATVNLYFNTVDIEGTVAGPSANTFGLSNAGISRNYRNNIFYNSRSSTSGNHYAMFISAAGGALTCDYNDYFVSGTGGILGYYGADKTSLPIVTGVAGNDVNSKALNPGFHNAGGSLATDYQPSASSLVAVSGTGITTDYAGSTRTYPAMGAYEYDVSPIVWNGSVGNSWNTAGNWSSNTVPTATDNVLIPHVTNDPVVNLAAASPAVCNNLTIQSGAVLTIPAGKALSINGTLTNNAGITGLVVESASAASDGTGSLINGTAGVLGTVERYVSGNLWHLISPAATAGETVINFVGATQNANLIARNLTNYALAPWLEATGKWDYYKVAGLNNGQFGTPAKGFQVLRATNAGTGIGGGADGGKLTFKGTLAAANLNIAVTKSLYGWNLIGNPYPCALDVTAFIAANTALLDPSFQFIYVSKIADVTTYGYDPNTAGLQLASGEGFFVKTIAGGGNINFTTAMKSNVADAFKAATVDNATIRLTAEGSNGKFGTNVEYMAGATKGLDPGKDAGLFNGTASSFKLFTRLIEDNGVDFTIQALPDNNLESMVIPVGLVADKGATVTFKAMATNLPAGFKVFLEDKETNTFTRLDEANSAYTVSLEAATLGTGRFYLHTTEIVSAIDESLHNEFKVVPIPEQNLVRIIGNFDLPAKAMVYDMNGKLVATSVLTSQIENDIPLTNCATGVYLLKVNSGKDVETVKFVWKRK